MVDVRVLSLASYEIIQEVNDAEDRETGLLPDAVLKRNPRRTATNSNLPVSGRTINHSSRCNNHLPQSRVADLARSHPTTHAGAYSLPLTQQPRDPRPNLLILRPSPCGRLPFPFETMQSIDKGENAAQRMERRKGGKVQRVTWIAKMSREQCSGLGSEIKRWAEDC